MHYNIYYIISVCGTRPWFKNAASVQSYPEGIHNGLSEAKIGIVPNRTQQDGINSKLHSVGKRHTGRFQRDSLWQKSRQGRIINGGRADYGEWPWQGSLQWKNGE